MKTLATQSARVSHLRVGLDNRSTPNVTPTPTPTISWRIETESPGWQQKAYELEINGVALARVDSRQSTHVPWPAPPIAPRQHVTVQVRVWGDGDSAPTSWSEPVVVVGALAPGEWFGHMIGPVEDTESRPGPGYLLRRSFTANESPMRAYLHVSAHGIFTARVNGFEASDDVLAPGWTSYQHRLRYRTYDVTSLVTTGENVLGIELSDGWYRGHVGFEGGRRNYYGDDIGVIAQLEIEHANGSRTQIVTDDSWRSITGPITATGLYAGEHYDARLERTGWDVAGYDDTDWHGVVTQVFDTAVLEPPYGPPVRRIETIAPVNVEQRTGSADQRTDQRTAQGTAQGTAQRETSIRYDFGQNASGRLRVTARGTAGARFTMRHAEVLEYGELGTRPLRRAEATDSYTFGDNGEVTWEPTFTIHGFRYAEIWPDAGVTIDHVEMIVLHSDMERTGWFECSNPLINRLHENVLWSMKGNFVDIPMDCPQRDERLGWTGDLQVFSPTASFLYDCEAFLRSWLADLRVEQAEVGTVPFYIPWVQLIFPSAPTCAWGDAAVLVPEALFDRYADPSVLLTQFESMCTWVRHVAAIASPTGLWDTGFQFGDWLDPAAPPTNPAAARTDASICATAYLFRSSKALARFAELLGHTPERDEFASIAERTREAFLHEYVTAGGRLASDAQTAYAVAILFGLLEGSQLAAAGRRLAKLVENDGFRIATGFIGTPLVCDALQRTGHVDVAYQLLNQTECPSWLYPVTMGATTIWERWDSMLPDGSINPGDMTSFNHYALGAVADWLHRTVAGLAFAEPGGRVLRIAPVPGGGLTSASASLRTSYGLAAVSWQREGTTLRVDVTVPPNCTALIELPDAPQATVGSGSHHFEAACRAATDDPVINPMNPFERLLQEQRDVLNAAADAAS